MRLLSIDWDYFFPVPNPIDDKEFMHDWCHSEISHRELYIHGLWTIRAAQFLDKGYPLPQTSGEEGDFWRRFRFSETPVLYYADSHSQIHKPEVIHNVREIFNFDAHHDAYESLPLILKNKIIHCGNWATILGMRGIYIYVIYPKWASWMTKEAPVGNVYPEVDNGFKYRYRFDKVFVCRSGAWTPTWIEDKFWQFIEDCPIATKVNIDGMQRREFSLKESEEMEGRIRKARENVGDESTT